MHQYIPVVMKNVLQDVLGDFVLVYLDDIVVASEGLPQLHSSWAHTFLTVMVKALRCLICSEGLLMVQVLFSTFPGTMFTKSKDAYWPGWQKTALLAGGSGSLNSNVITSRHSCRVLRHGRC